MPIRWRPIKIVYTLAQKLMHTSVCQWWLTQPNQNSCARMCASACLFVVCMYIFMTERLHAKSKPKILRLEFEWNELDKKDGPVCFWFWYDTPFCFLSFPTRTQAIFMLLLGCPHTAPGWVFYVFFLIKCLYLRVSQRFVAVVLAVIVKLFSDGFALPLNGYTLHIQYLEKWFSFYAKNFPRKKENAMKIVALV